MSTQSRRVDVIASLPMETLLRSLELPGNLRYASEQVSLESQQMDEQERLDKLAAHHVNLQKLLKSEKPTGTPHLFVLDPEKLAVGDIDANTTLQALANQQFSNARNAAVAMLPPDAGYTVVGQATANILKDGLLNDLGVVTLESVDALVNWIGPVTVSMEKIGFLRRLFESKDKASTGSVTHQQIRDALKEKGGTYKPWTEEEVAYVEEALNVSFNHDVHRLLTSIGSIDYKGLVIFNPIKAIENTREFLKVNTAARSKVKNWVILSAQEYADEPGVTYYVIVDAPNGKASAFSSAGGYIYQPNIPFSNMLLLAVQTTK